MQKRTHINVSTKLLSDAYKCPEMFDALCFVIWAKAISRSSSVHYERNKVNYFAKAFHTNQKRISKILKYVFDNNWAKDLGDRLLFTKKLWNDESYLVHSTSEKTVKAIGKRGQVDYSGVFVIHIPTRMMTYSEVKAEIRLLDMLNHIKSSAYKNFNDEHRSYREQDTQSNPSASLKSSCYGITYFMKRFGISRGSVYNLIKVLESRGLVTREKAKAFFVRDLYGNSSEMVGRYYRPRTTFVLGEEGKKVGTFLITDHGDRMVGHRITIEGKKYFYRLTKKQKTEVKEKKVKAVNVFLHEMALSTSTPTRIFYENDDPSDYDTL